MQIDANSHRAMQMTQIGRLQLASIAFSAQVEKWRIVSHANQLMEDIDIKMEDIDFTAC